MRASAQDEVVLRTAVELEPEAVEAVAERLSSLLGRTVTVVQRCDARIRGAVIVLDEQHQIRIDPARPVAGLARELDRLPHEGGLGVRARLAEETIESFEPGTGASIGDTNLRTALASLDGGRVTLVTRVDVGPAVVVALTEKLSAAAGRDIVVDTQVDPHAEDGAALMLGEDRRLVLDARYQFLSDLERSLARQRELSPVGPGDASPLIRDMIESTEPELRIRELLDTGTVLDVGDGVASVAGVRGVGSMELVEFENGAFGLAFGLGRDEVGCILLGSEEDIHEGSRVKRTGHLLRVPVGDGLLGRIVNSMGQPIDAAGPIQPDSYEPAERLAPGVVEREPVSVPLHTGVKVVDALVPLGRGQRELIIGDRKIGKTTLAVDTILSQKGAGVYCVYAAIGQKASSVARVAATLEEHGALEYTTIVASLPGEQPAFRHLTPYTACAIGEHFMDSGRDALVVYDDLTKHAVTYREMSALLGRPIGREAYPGDIFYVHSRLLERAARRSEARGGGSLTALPIIETQAGDISAFIPTNVVSICDGQIFLSAELFNEGSRPALDVGLSVSRVGGAAQTPAMKRVAGRLRIDLAQYHEMAQFVKFGAEVDRATLEQLNRGERSRELLKQPQHSPIPMGLEVAVLYAAVGGHLDGVDVGRVAEFERGLIAHLRAEHPGMLESLEAPDAALTEELERELSVTIESFKHRFKEE
jgi:F-type H+-transporting ATPase subunit alpha